MFRSTSLQFYWYNRPEYLSWKVSFKSIMSIVFSAGCVKVSTGTSCYVKCQKDWLQGVFIKPGSEKEAEKEENVYEVDAGTLGCLPGYLQPWHPQWGVIVIGQRALGAICGRGCETGWQCAILQTLFRRTHLQDLQHNGRGGVLQVGHRFATRDPRQIHPVHV